MASTKKGLRVVAILEATKGIVSLIVGFGLHTLAGHNMQHVAETIVSHAHLNPASHLPSIFISAASTITDSNVNLLAIGALFYSLIRLLEAYGLWKGFLWTKWFALISGAIYLPFEIREIIVHTNILSVSVFLLNALIIWYMLRVILSKDKDTEQ